MVPILLAVSMAIFGLIQLQPGDFIDELRLANPKITQEDILRLRREYGLDQPWYVQYGKWLNRAVRLDFGLSRENGYEPAANFVFEQRLGNTITLSATAFFIALFIGIPIGIYAAVRQYSFIDNVTTLLSFDGFSVPLFWLGLMMTGTLYLDVKLPCSSGAVALSSTLHRKATLRFSTFYSVSSSF